MSKGLKEVREETRQQTHVGGKPRWKSIAPETPALPERIYYAIRENGKLVKIELFGYRGEKDGDYYPVAARLWNDKRDRWQWPDFHYLKEITKA